MIGKKIGNYEILEEIGVGGIATVYRGVDTTIDRPVAIKVLHENYQKDEHTISRFIGDAKALGQFEHPNIVKIYGTDLENHCFIMEFASGKDLKTVIKETGPLEIKRGLKITRQICQALRYVHLQNIIHRDIKPQNIMISKNDQVKLLDFSIARLGDRLSTTTASGATLGSAHYMSPEQIEDTAVVDLRTDVYSLGVVLYEMFTGRVPFSSEGESDENVWSVFDRIQNAPVIEPCEINPRISPGLSEIIKKTMARNVDERYQSIGELLAVMDYLESKEKKPSFVKQKIAGRGLKFSFRLWLSAVIVLGILGVSTSAYLLLSKRGEEAAKPVVSTEEIKPIPEPRPLAVPSGVISWRDAAQYYEQYKTVEGTIVQASISKNGKVCFLNFDPDWKHTFTAVIFAKDFFRFPASPENYYRGKKVRVTGHIVEYQGKPEIIVNDPSQIEILEGEAAAPAVAPAVSVTPVAPVAVPAPVVTTGKININTASQSELESLSGIGPAYAQAIIAGRPYATVDDLVRARGIGPKTLERLKPLITVK